MRKVLRITILVLLPVLVWSQNNKSIEVTYIKAYKNYRDTTITAPEKLKAVEYKLVGNLNEARFEYIPNMINDADRKHKLLISRGGGKGVYYKNIKDKEKLHKVISPLDDKAYILKSSLDEYKWEITNEKKNISGYTCYKAIATYEIELPVSATKTKKNTITIVVWFAPEINYSYGPAGYDGLPGLVLEKSSGSYYFIASKVVFKETESNIDKPLKGTVVSKEEYEQLMKKQLKKLN